MWRKALASLALVPLLGLSFSVRAESVPTVEEVIAHFPFKESDQDKLFAGEIVSYELESGTDKELAIVIALLVRAPLDEVVEYVLEGQVLRAGKTVIEVHFFDDRPPSEALFNGVGFTEDESEELAKLLRAAPGSNFNLSRKEIERLNTAAEKVKTSGSADDPAIRNAMNDAYRAILMDRYAAFRQGGLGEIAPYYRGSETVEPGEELRRKVERSAILKSRLPNFYRALLNYPNDGMDGIHNRFALVKQVVDNRPAYVLSRRMIQHERGEYALYAYQEYYVGHSYNSLQITSGAKQVQKGSIIFYVNRTSTDQVAGFGGGMKRSIGRGMLKSAVIEQFDLLRQSVE